MQYRVKIEWNQEDGSFATAEFGQVDCGPCQSAADVGVKLADAKPLLARLQQVVVSQLRDYCAAARPLSVLSGTQKPEGLPDPAIRYCAGTNSRGRALDLMVAGSAVTRA